MGRAAPGAPPGEPAGNHGAPPQVAAPARTRPRAPPTVRARGRRARNLPSFPPLHPRAATRPTVSHEPRTTSRGPGRGAQTPAPGVATCAPAARPAPLGGADNECFARKKKERADAAAAQQRVGPPAIKSHGNGSPRPLAIRSSRAHAKHRELTTQLNQK